MSVQFASLMTAGALIVIGFYAVIFLDNLIKKIMGLTFVADGVNLMLIALGYREGGIVPIILEGMDKAAFAANAAYPLPMALVLTSIVISVSTVALILGLTVKLYAKYNTLSVKKIWGE